MSVVMPNYNHGHFLADALGAIGDQSVLPYEVIVVDDGSTDDSLVRLEELTARMPWLRIIKHGTNRGVNAACNTGLTAATGEFVLFSAMDDRLHPDMVARASSAIAAFPRRPGVVFSDPAEMKADGTGASIVSLDLPTVPTYFSSDEFVELLQKQFFFFSVTNVWFRVDQLQKFGGFPPELRWHGDLFAAYAAAFQDGAIYAPGAIAYFRVQPSSYSADGRRSAAQKEVLRAWHSKTKEIGGPRVRMAFVRAGVLPEFTLRSALILLKTDPGYLTPRLAFRFIWLIVWTAVASYVHPAFRKRLRRIRSALRRR
jgi:glycosyltransferase involved in cell wall biosynthesis